MKLYLISDLHLAPPGETSKSLDTPGRLDAALADLRENHADADLCVILGDLADHGPVSAYESLRDKLADLPMPVRLLLGNHDHRENFRAVFPTMPCDPNGFVQSVLDTPEGRLVFLDTHEPDQAGGRLCEARAAWLRDRLAEARDRPVYLFMHHPPFEIGMIIDKLRLADPGALRALLATHPDVRQIFAGHTHRPCSGLWQGLPFANIGATHYNVGVSLLGSPGPIPRYLFPITTAVVLIRDGDVVVHQADVSHTRIPLAPQLFPAKPMEALIAMQGRLAPD